MPSATMMSATIASSSVNPSFPVLSTAIETCFCALERAVELAGQLEPARKTVARDFEPERRDFAARQQHHLRLRLLEIHALEVSLQLHVLAVQYEIHEELRMQVVRLQQLVVRHVDPCELRVVIHVE